MKRYFTIGILTFLLCMFGLFKTGVSAADFYVSPAGNDKAPGSKEQPFRTIQRGVDELLAGDTLYIGEGTYYEEVVIPDSATGIGNGYITITNVPGERAVLSGEGRTNSTLMILDGCGFVKLMGLEFQKAFGDNACAIMVNAGTNNFVIRDNVIHDIRVIDNSKAESTEEPDGEQPEQKEEEDSKEQHEERELCANAILVFGDEAKHVITGGAISYNTIYDCDTGHSEAVSVTGNVYDITIRGNLIKNTGNIGIDVSGNYGYCKDPAKDFPRYCLITKNTVEGCVSNYATAYGIYVDGAQDVTVSNNTVTGCGGGIEIGAEKRPVKTAYCTRRIKVTGNTVKNNIENGITIGGYKKKLGWVTNVTVRKNICTDNGSAVLTLSKCKKVIVTDNTFYNTASGGYIVYSDMNEKYTNGVTFKNNVYGSRGNIFKYQGVKYKTLKDWCKATSDVGSCFK